MNHLRKSERGQALVLIILAVLGIFGFSALAIDGGMLYAERRRAQNAADAAVYAGALHMAQSGYNYATNPGGWNSAYAVATSKAINQATTNGFTTSSSTIVTFVSPPDTAYAPVPPAYVGNRSYYLMVIESEMKPVFSQFIFNGLLQNKVWAIARAHPHGPLVNGTALFATSDDPAFCNALDFGGTGNALIEGGNVISNNSNDGTSNSACWSARVSGTGRVDIEGGQAVVVGDYDTNGGGLVSTDLVGVDPWVTHHDPMDLYPLPMPDCSIYSSVSSNPPNIQSDESYTIEPGRYKDLSWNGGTLNLKPGMYCIESNHPNAASAGFSVNGGNVYSVRDGSVPEGVFFVILSGNFKIGGGGNIVINRPDELVSNAFQWGGYLLYMPPGNHGSVVFGGGGDSEYSGTVYAPGDTASNSQYKCTLAGTGDSLAMNSQIICNTVNVTGTAVLNIVYDPSRNGQRPAVVELMN